MDEEGKRLSSSLLVQNATDHIRDTALQTHAVSGKAFQKWLSNPFNIMFPVIIVVANIHLLVAIAQGFLMILTSKVSR